MRVIHAYVGFRVRGLLVGCKQAMMENQMLYKKTKGLRWLFAGMKRKWKLPFRAWCKFEEREARRRITVQ